MADEEENFSHYLHLARMLKCAVAANQMGVPFDFRWKNGGQSAPVSDGWLQLAEALATGYAHQITETLFSPEQKPS